MTTVADLVAKLGFKVDDSGFNKFKNSLQAFQSIVRDGIKDLKEYAKQAEKISKAFQNAYLPSRKDAEARFRADTYAIRARAYAQRIRARELPETLSIRRMNAEIRERQTALKERGIYLGSGVSQFGTLASLLNLLARFVGGSGGILGSILGGIGGLIGSIAGPLGKAIGTVLGKVVGGTLMTIGRMIVNGLKSAIGYAIAFRDYRSFTGRSSSGLNNMMGMTKWMTNMGPQDILKDATAMGQAYWDMWFGGGNPAAWQLLGLTPTMNGETNLKNILNRIYSVTGGAKDKGLALNLLKQFGLSEDYMNLFYHWDEYKAKGGEGSFLGFSEKEIDSVEKANASLRDFEMALNQAKVRIVQVLLDSGLEDALKTIVDYIKGVAKALKEGESIWSALTNAKRNIHYGSTGQWTTPKQWDASNGHWYDTEWSDFIPIYGQLNVAKRLLSSLFGIDMVDLASAPVQASQSTRNLFGGNTFNNTFNMQGQPLEQSVTAANDVQTSQNQLSTGYTMAPTFSG